jgi:hypothetical protein
MPNELLGITVDEGLAWCDGGLRCAANDLKNGGIFTTKSKIRYSVH